MVKKPEVIYPNKTRVRGNLLQHFKTDKSPFEDFHVNTQYEKQITNNNIKRNEYKITPAGEKCTITLTTNPVNTTTISNESDIITITATLTAQDTDKTPIVGQDVYFEDNGTQIDQIITDMNGQVSYEYSSSKSGDHNIHVYTKFSNGWNGASANITIKVLKTPKLTISSPDRSRLHNNQMKVNIRLEGEDDNGIPNESVRVYSAGHDISPSTPTNSVGEISYSFSELNQGVADKSTHIANMSVPLFVQGSTVSITGQLFDSNNDTVVSASLLLYMDYETPAISSTVTDDSGNFSINIPVLDEGKHILHLVYNGSESSDNTKYTLLPVLWSRSINVVPAPTLTLTTTASSVYTKGSIKMGVNISTSDENTLFTDEEVIIQKSTDNGATWSNYASYTFTDNNNLTFYFQDNTAETVKVRAVYPGNDYYAEADSNIIPLTFSRKPMVITANVNKNKLYVNETFSVNISVSTGEKNSTESYSGAVLLYYLDSLDNNLGSVTIDSSNTASFMLSISDKGSHTIIIKHIESNNWEEYTNYVNINVLKQERTLTVDTPTTALISTNFTINTNVTYNNQALSGQEITITDGTTTKTITSGDDGTKSTTWKITKAGQYILKFTIPETEEYSETTVTKGITIKNLPELPMTMDNIDTTIGTSTTLTAKVPTDATGTFTIALVPQDGSNTRVIIANLTQDNGVVTHVTKWSTITQGKYWIELRYSGCDKYAKTTKQVAELNLAGSITITCDNISNGVITTAIRSLIKLTGSVTDEFGVAFSGALNVYVVKNNTEIQAGTYTVRDGKYGDLDTDPAIDTNSDDLQLTQGSYKLILRCTGESGVLGERSTTLKIIKLSNLYFSTDSDIYGNKGGLLYYHIYLSDLPGGTLTLNQVDDNRNTISTIATVDLSTANYTSYTDNEGNKFYHFSGTSTVFKDNSLPAGEYHCLATVTGSSYYDDITYGSSDNSYISIMYRQQAVIQPTAVRTYEGNDTDVTVQVTDTLGNPYQGVITVNDGTNGNVSIEVGGSNGAGKGVYTVPGDIRTYDKESGITTLNWSYTYTGSHASFFNGKLDATAVSYTYNIPQTFVGVFINGSSNFDSNADTIITNWNTMGITDLYIYCNQESSSFTTLDSVISKLGDNLSNYRIHAVVPCLRNNSTNTWYTTNGIVNASRITDLKTHFKKLLDTYGTKISGICLDYIRLGSAASTNEDQVTNALTQLTDYLKSLTPTRTLIISSCLMSEYTNAISVYGQNYSTFNQYNDSLIPMLYLYDYTNGSDYSWLQTNYRGVLSTAHAKLTGCITTYKGDSNTTSKVGFYEYKYQLVELLNEGSHGYIFFREGLFGSSLPPSYNLLKSTSDSSTKLETSITLSSTTISKATASTKGISIVLRDTRGGYLRKAGKIRLKLDSEVLTLSNSDTTMNYDGSTTFNVPVDLSTYSNGSHTLNVYYNGSLSYKYNAKSTDFTITLTD